MDSIKVLVADDNDSDRMILSSILNRQGHEVVQAANGREAVELFSSERPNLILLDALMPEMDGFEAAKAIKALAGDDLVPIIFLTSLRDAESLARCLEVGGDDFLSKPYNRVILEAKIQAFQRMRQMHQTLQHQMQQIAANNAYLLQEQRVAKSVFDNVAHTGCLDAPNIKSLLSPLAVFNGDVLLAAYTPSGGMHLLLGDFTGHGLPAAIGAMPLAEIFYGMTGKGFGMIEVLREINLKLKTILPVGVFSCVGMIEVNFNDRSLRAWLGGLPDCFLVRKNGEVEVLASTHLPVGVLGNSEFDASVHEVQMNIGDRFYLWSDGIQEASNGQEEMYGEERLMQNFTANRDQDVLFDEIKNSVAEFIGDSERDDDITMLEVMMLDAEEINAEAAEFKAGAIAGPTDWKLAYQLGPETLRDFNPLPLLLHILMEVPGLRPHSSSLYTVLAELYSNALEHGVIGLNSKLKSDPAGFATYYSQRQQRLSTLTNGFVEFVIEHIPKKDGGELRLQVADSGAGFEYNNEAAETMSSDDEYHGRGIPLISSLCSDVQYLGCGNEVRAVFNWQH
ncbi:MAG: CheY-like chemotaxis protein/anti-sigma regulatory factor (Ser/Thr protein kinase) [Candidatus Azotimanducaceae bacterium]|jgi:CheY-like chemotaxis protein/anti-sigma regulatory factor (Ser/Thr protein kinase)